MPDSTANERLVFNERAKLLTSALNVLTTFTLGGSVIAPAIAAFWSRDEILAGLPASRIVLGVAIWLCLAAALHFAGQIALAGLKQP